MLELQDSMGERLGGRIGKRVVAKRLVLMIMLLRSSLPEGQAKRENGLKYGLRHPLSTRVPCLPADSAYSTIYCAELTRLIAGRARQSHLHSEPDIKSIRTMRRAHVLSCLNPRESSKF